MLCDWPVQTTVCSTAVHDNPLELSVIKMLPCRSAKCSFLSTQKNNTGLGSVFNTSDDRVNSHHDSVFDRYICTWRCNGINSGRSRLTCGHRYRRAILHNAGSACRAANDAMRRVRTSSAYKIFFHRPYGAWDCVPPWLACMPGRMHALCEAFGNFRINSHSIAVLLVGAHMRAAVDPFNDT